MEGVKFFLLNQWQFSDNNVKNLITSISAEDNKIFNFDVENINWETCIQDYIFGSRKYLLNIDDSEKYVNKIS